MFTSCGWFFNDLCGIETRQILLYAARALDLAESLGAGDIRQPFLEALSRATGNGLEAPDGREVLLEETQAARVSASDVAADWFAHRVAGVAESSHAAWRTEGEWATAEVEDSRALAGTLQVTDARTGDVRSFRGRGISSDSGEVRLVIQPEGQGGEDSSLDYDLNSLRPETRAAIEGREAPSGGRSGEWGAGVLEILASIEVLEASEGAERESLLCGLKDLLERDEVDSSGYPLWELQNGWWRATRYRSGTVSEVEEDVARCLGFSD
jgi:hypothetical protein